MDDTNYIISLENNIEHLERELAFCQIEKEKLKEDNRRWIAACMGKQSGGNFKDYIVKKKK